MKNVCINDDKRVQGHLHKPYYTHAARLLRAALRDHAYTAVRSLKYPQRHLCAGSDDWKVYRCLVLIFRTLRAVSFSSTH